MTEYWVSQGNKWCDQCKIFISNNPISIRTHELGQRHKDNVTKRLAAMRKENIAKEKEKQQAVKDLQQIEAKAMRSYKKDLAAIKETKVMSTDEKYGTSKSQLGYDRNMPVSSAGSQASEQVPGTSLERNSVEWVYDKSSGYYFNEATKYYYDPNSGLYYSDALGKWVTQEAANNSSEVSRTEVGAGNLLLSDEGRVATKQATSKASANTKESSKEAKTASGPPPGLVLPASKVSLSSAKAAPSSIQVIKRKREEKTGHVSSEEATAIAAREAARKRTEEREKSLLGLYKFY